MKEEKCLRHSLYTPIHHPLFFRFVCACVCVCLVFLSPLLPILHSLRGLSNLSLSLFCLFYSVSSALLLCLYSLSLESVTCTRRAVQGEGKGNLKFTMNARACLGAMLSSLALSLPPNPCGFESAPHRFFFSFHYRSNPHSRVLCTR